MEYNKIGHWALGYLDAILNGEEVSKAQLETLIQKLKEMVAAAEDSNSHSLQPDNGMDDLPF
jgi:hypothetical protein